MDRMYERTALALGQQNVEKLSNAHVLVLGVGGVGSFCVEALVRTGIGRLTVVDRDVVEPSNINRQLIATHESIGQSKVELIQQRARLLNPDCVIRPIHAFYDRQMDETLFDGVDIVVDCIDSIASKQDCMLACLERKIPFLMSMGMARRQDPSQIGLMELEKTSYDPMAKRLRLFKRKMKIRDKIWVVASTEKPVQHIVGQPLPSTIFTPASAGLLLASTVVKWLLEGRH